MKKILQDELVKLAKELCEENFEYGFDTFVMCYDNSDWLEFFMYSLDLKCLIPFMIYLFVNLKVVEIVNVFLIVLEDS